jgi:GNAT superfamily N-acetyltransferase
MNRKHEALLAAIFEDPVRANIEWREVESLLVSLGAEITQGRGSRVRIALGGARTVVHRPHPRKEVGKLMVRDLRDWLRAAGIAP